MRHSFGRHQKIAGSHRQLAALEQKQSIPLDDRIHLVHAGMGVERVRLPGLERIEPDQ
jgi:hypothetical protein